jgi:hypothetical protein
MAHLVSFTTSILDPAAEPPNPINPIPGISVLTWLRENVLRDDDRSTEPDAEDWGWYMYVDHGGSTYLVGGNCLIDDEAPSPPNHEWMIQIDKRRSLVERFLGKNRLSADDPLLARIVDAVRSEDAFVDIHIERDA